MLTAREEVITAISEAPTKEAREALKRTYHALLYDPEMDETLTISTHRIHQAGLAILEGIAPVITEYRLNNAELALTLAHIMGSYMADGIEHG